jgi:hypothetical protein
MKSFAETVRDDDRLLHGPQGKGEGLKQDDVDRMMTGRDMRAQAAASAAAASWREAEQQLPPAAGATAREGSGGFDQPETLTLAELDPIKRAALFG